MVIAHLPLRHETGVEVSDPGKPFPGTLAYILTIAFKCLDVQRPVCLCLHRSGICQNSVCRVYSARPKSKSERENQKGSECTKRTR